MSVLELPQAVVLVLTSFAFVNTGRSIAQNSYLILSR
jgi:hypothetical protein